MKGKEVSFGCAKAELGERVKHNIGELRNLHFSSQF